MLKKIILWGGFLTMFLSFLGGCRSVPVTEIRTFRFSVTENMSMYGQTVYELEVKDDGTGVITVKPCDVPDEEAVTAAVDADFVRGLEAMLRENGVGGWNGFDRVDKRVLDGRSFSLSVTMAGGKSISAHGYMKWPKNYREVRAALDEMFTQAASSAE